MLSDLYVTEDRRVVSLDTPAQEWRATKAGDEAAIDALIRDPAIRHPELSPRTMGTTVDAGARGDYKWTAGGSGDWQREVQRFFDQLAALDAQLASPAPPDASIEPLIQGPLADTFTHVGQLSMLRGMAGAPVRPESYARAEIVLGRVGREQAASKKEFEGDASAKR